MTMASYDGAKTSKLIGTFTMSLIIPKFKGQLGLYRDNGLAVCKATAKQIGKTMHKVSEIFKSNEEDLTNPS